MDGPIAAVLSLAIIALGIDASTCYLKRIRDDQADPVINPTWTSDMRPARLHLAECRPGDETNLFVDQGD